MRKCFMMVLFGLAACGGHESTSAPATVSLQPAGANPLSISVMGGAQLRFINSDEIDHRVASSDCPELSSPTLAAGASFTATVGSGPKTCSFDDALLPSAAAFHGTVIVQSSTDGSDAGYGNPYGP